MFHLSALAIGLSILLHSSTDVVTAQWLMKHMKNGDSPGS